MPEAEDMESRDNSYRVALFERMARRLNLRFPVLFAVFLVLTLIDLLVPDFIPFVDEAGLAILTLLLGLWKNRRPPGEKGRLKQASVREE